MSVPPSRKDFFAAGDDGLVWVNEALDHPPPEPPVLVDGLIRAGELLVLGAPRGVGKSWWIYNLAAHLAFGDGAFLDRLAVHRRARTLILQGELDPWASAQRWRSLLGDDRPVGIAESFEPVRLRVREVRQTRPGVGGTRTETFHEGELDPRVEEWIVAHGFDVLVLDPWAVFFAGAENSNDEVEAALSQLRGLALRHGTAIVIVHHLGKAAEARDPEDLWRGASRLADWASTRVTMLSHYSSKAAVDAGLTPQQARRFLDFHFLRRHEPLDDFSVHLDELGVMARWDPPDDDAPRRPVRLTPDDVGRAIVEHGGAFASVNAAASVLGVGREKARQALDRAVLAGIIVRTGHGTGAHSYALSPVLGAAAAVVDEEGGR